MVERTISHYRILSKLGEGGMGVVYKAEDTRLDRIVALKFLATHLLSDVEAKQRFIREAKAAAALDHPNICTVHEIDEVEGKTFIAMAYLEGQTLKDLIGRAPLKLGDALDIGAQVARGLQEAHTKGVYHRDIKPSNLVLLEKSGAERLVKITDFGLAHFADRSHLTRKGSSMGTPTYMSPEQTLGQPTDQRTDLWSLGVVLYEMVVGQAPFGGDYEQAVIYSILNESHEPITALRAGVPMEVEWIVSKALAKNREQRYQHADDILVDLVNLHEKVKASQTTKHTAVSTTGVTQAGTHTGPWGATAARESLSSGGALGSTGFGAAAVAGGGVASRDFDEAWRQKIRFKRALMGTSAALVVSLIAILWLAMRETPSVAELPLRRFAFTATENVDAAVISPNGGHIAYIAGTTARVMGRIHSAVTGSLWVRDLDQQAPRLIGGSKQASSPFWSPDSEFLVFLEGSQLKKVSVRGGSPVVLCNLPSGGYGGGTWSPDGESIVFSLLRSDAGLYTVPAGGGSPELLMAEPQPNQVFVAPHFLPSGQHLIVGMGDLSEQEIVVADLATGERETLGKGAFPVYSPTGHILYQTAPRSDGLWALPFSMESLEATASPFLVAENGHLPTVAADGTLIYTANPPNPQQLTWRNRRGEKLATIGQPQRRIVDPALSPDEQHVAVRAWNSENENSDIWIHDTSRAVTTRLTFEPADDTGPIWSPSGQAVTYLSRKAGNLDILRRGAGGRGEPEQLIATSRDELAHDWTADEKYLIYSVEAEETNYDLWYIEQDERTGKRQSKVFLQTPFRELAAKFSQDGRYVVYCSDESGQFEVYVRPFPEGDTRWQLSLNGGTQPIWAQSGREIYYVEGDTLIAASVTTGSSGFSVGSTTPLFQDEDLRYDFPLPIYDVSSDGQRFVLVETKVPEQNQPVSIHVVQNWFAGFRD